MKQYIFKLQWYFNLWDAEQAIKLLGARNLTAIYIKDIDLNTLYTYTDMISYPTGKSEREAIKFIKDKFKKDQKTFQVELYKK